MIAMQFILGRGAIEDLRLSRDADAHEAMIGSSIAG